MNIKAELRKITALALWKKKISEVQKENYTF